MADITKETVTTHVDNAIPVAVSSDESEATNYQTIEYLIYFFFGALEVLLVFRLILKLMGASITSAFVNLIYVLSGIFILPFEGIFHQATTTGIETTAVLDPAIVVAIIVYAVLGVGIVKLLRISSGKKQQAG